MEILKKGELVKALVEGEIVYAYEVNEEAGRYCCAGGKLKCGRSYNVFAFAKGGLEGIHPLSKITELIMQGDLTATREKPVVFREGQIVRYTLPDGSYSFCFIIESLSGNTYSTSSWNDGGAIFKVCGELLTPVELIEKP